MTVTSSAAPYLVATWRCYLALAKPRIVAVITFTAVIGALLARPHLPPLDKVVWGSLGILLAAGCAATLNHIFDRHIDQRMARTRARPLPVGQVSTQQAALFAGALGCTGIGALLLFVNTLTAVLTFAALIGYGCIYTLWLKHSTPQNIVIGGVAGAAPPVLGWTAVTGSVDLHAVILFLIIFVWTPPHFWSLAIARRREYALAGVPMLPVTHGVEYTRTAVLAYTILLALVTMAPVLTRMSGSIYLIAALALNGGFLYYATALKVSRRVSLPMKVFRYSINYLAVLFAALLVDHYWHVGTAS
jgi:protoheme IX farnesyltransferase